VPALLARLLPKKIIRYHPENDSNEIITPLLFQLCGTHGIDARYPSKALRRGAELRHSFRQAPCKYISNPRAESSYSLLARRSSRLI
jgi:hypothetical protein